MEDRLRSNISAAAFGAIIALIGAMAPAQADNWPSRPITLVVPFGAGSGTDVIARLVANKASEYLGKPIIVEDLGGAGGTIAVSRVARATPDGYQFIIGAVDTFAQSQYLFENPPADTMKDFDPVALAVDQPLVFLAKKALPVSNMKEFADYLKVHQKDVKFGSAGIGAAPYLACATITRAIGAEATHVAYRAAAPALQDMLRGDIDYYCPLAVSAVPFMKQEQVKTLAVLTPERSMIFPDLPTAREQGINFTDGYYWNAFFVPKGTPEEVVKKLNLAISRALDDQNVGDRLKDLAAAPVPSNRRSPEYLRKYLGDEITKWATIMKELNVERLHR
jgi:tripartite-type tricarboxylate transporter receptor subunit TctC